MAEKKQRTEGAIKGRKIIRSKRTEDQRENSTTKKQRKEQREAKIRERKKQDS